MTNDTDTAGFSLFTDYDISLFRAGKHFHLYNKLGSHIVTHNNSRGTYFAVWAPNAKEIYVTGDFNSWDKTTHRMNVRYDSSGIWELFISDIGEGTLYKYFIRSHNGYEVEKADPYARQQELPPRTASIVCDTSYKWGDKKWLKSRNAGDQLQRPLSIYEVHIGSWRRNPGEGNRFLTYPELAQELPPYCQYMGFTHVELMPVMEHPFYGSWGYQVTGYFAPTSRYGTPADFMRLVDALHNAGIGVLLDWVPSHFPSDTHGLSYFDGTHLYEHEDPRKGFHPDWNSLIYNYGRNEVRAFLISNAIYWLDVYHADGLRVDAVASMLYLDYSRKEGAWIANEYGGRENLEATSFLAEMNDVIHEHYPDVLTIAEESTAWPGVTKSTQAGGLGFDLKWMMGWMHDTLLYFRHDPVYRSYHQGLLTFGIYYAFSEKFLLPLSHDEVVHGKGSLINKMPGDEWQQFANIRLLYAWMYTHPGAKMIFMGGEFAQRREWRHDHSLDWDENNHPLHHGIQKTLKDLNALYIQEPALYRCNYDPAGFEWLDMNDTQNSVLCWMRKGNSSDDFLIIVANYTPVPHENYRVGVPALGRYTEIFSSDSVSYGGSGIHNAGEVITAPISMHNRQHSLALTLPPLGLIILAYKGKDILI